MRLPARRPLAGVLTLVALLPWAAAASPSRGDSELVRVLRSGLPGLQAADRAAANGRGSPEAIQAQYDTARDLEEALARVQPISRGCLPLLRAAEKYARGQVLAAEGFDRRSVEIASAGETMAQTAEAELTRIARTCTSGHLVQSYIRPELLEPRSGEAFFGAVHARAPAGAREMEVRLDGRRWAIVAARAGEVTFPLKAQPGRHHLEVRFLARGERVLAAARSDDIWLLPAAANRLPPFRHLDRDLAARLAAVANSFPGQSGIWVENLSTGRTAGWNSDARFPAASTVKLAVLVAALARFGPRPERSEIAHDLEALTGWSSNLAANRLLSKLGGSEHAGARIAQQTLRRLGANSSSYTGDYRVGTSTRRAGDEAPDPPPLISQRVTTAHDLARILYLLHTAALGNRAARQASSLTTHEARVGLALLLDSQPTSDNIGLFRPWLDPSFPIAQKSGWLSDARHTAAILYTPTGPRIAVLLTYHPNLTQPQAAALGQGIVHAALAAP